MKHNKIFVQIASYRDPQLIQTIFNLIKHSDQPDRLRIVVCWQHAPDETLGAFWKRGFTKWRFATIDGWTVHTMEYNGARIDLIDVPHFKSQGACWARNLIQQHYREERYTLQIDAHHRFVDRWDMLLIEMLESVRDQSPKPVLTAYLPGYEPDLPTPQSSEPHSIQFSRFNSEGVLMVIGGALPNWKTLDRPVRSRFYCAAFAFADGHFATTVQHDPEFFFYGEEISIAARAFTHGYDLYHPQRVITWHDYTRKDNPRIWGDHTNEAKESGDVSKTWWDRDSHSFQRNRELFGMAEPVLTNGEFGKYGFGTERTLADYETYAGLCFRLRGVQRSTLDNVPPVLGATRPDSEAEWIASLVRSNEVSVCLHEHAFLNDEQSQGSRAALLSAVQGHLVVYDSNEMALHSQDLEADALTKLKESSWLDFRAVFLSDIERIPTNYAVELFNDAGDLLAQVTQAIEA
ncbi:GlcNAc-transferase family protein [Trinickia sp. YCB016]